MFSKISLINLLIINYIILVKGEDEWISAQISLNSSIKVENDEIFECLKISKDGIFPESGATTIIVNTRNSPEHEYTYYVAPKSKCFSFQVRAKQNVQVSLSKMPQIAAPMLEFIFGDTYWKGFHSAIRRDYNHNTQNPLVSTPNIVNENEFKGFWVRWNDNGVFEAGYENNPTPFMLYAEKSMFQIDYIGIRTTAGLGTWILKEPFQCPGSEVQDDQNIEVKCRKVGKMAKIDVRNNF